MVADLALHARGGLGKHEPPILVVAKATGDAREISDIARVNPFTQDEIGAPA